MADESTIAGMPELRLEWHMDNWRRYMRSGVGVDGLPGRSAVCQGGGMNWSKRLWGIQRRAG